MAFPTEHAKLGAGMLPGASAPLAPAGYHNVVIVPGLTAVLPEGYTLPAYIASAATGVGLARKPRILGCRF